jgi:hypothetical protein
MAGAVGLVAVLAQSVCHHIGVSAAPVIPHAKAYDCQYVGAADTFWRYWQAASKELVPPAIHNCCRQRRCPLSGQCTCTAGKHAELTEERK